MRAEAKRIYAELDKAAARPDTSGLTAEDIAIMRAAVAETLGSPFLPARDEAFLPARDAHALAVRLVGLCYACAFYGNVLDGPIMWLLAPPGDDGGWSEKALVRFARRPTVVSSSSSSLHTGYHQEMMHTPRTTPSH